MTLFNHLPTTEVRAMGRKLFGREVSLPFGISLILAWYHTFGAARFPRSILENRWPGNGELKASFSDDGRVCHRHLVLS